MYSLLGHQGIQQVVIQGWIMHEMYLLWFISNLNVAFMLINSSSAYQIQSHCITKHKIFIFSRLTRQYFYVSDSTIDIL